METDSTVCKVMCLLVLALVCVSCLPLCDDDTDDTKSSESCIDRPSEPELDSSGCPVDPNPPHSIDPIECDEYHVESYEYSEYDEDYLTYYEFEGTCCDWEVSFDSYKRYCLWVDSCGWEYVGEYDFEEKF